MRTQTLLRTIAILLLFAATGAHAQQRKVSGVISDEKGSPLPGITIIIEGSQIGAVTNVKGEFTINATPQSVLVISGLGFQTHRITVGSQTNIKYAMKERNQELDAVVVTALGMTRSEKSLGYSVAKLSNEEITTSVSSNWLDGLAGKVAGLTFNQPSAGPSGSTRVTLRGESSLNPANSQALFVVDGVPINSTLTGSTTSSGFATTGVDLPVDYGDGASDLNPDDIESVTVLKGPSATALYGSRAANGAIIITTKSGKAEKGIGVTFSSSATFQNAGYWPDLQNEYGAGAATSLLQSDVYSFYTFTDPNNVSHTASTQNHAWGPRFEGQMFYQYGGRQPDGTYVATPWVARDWYKGIFQTGTHFYNSVVIEGNNGRGASGRLSFSNTDNKWITPNSGYKRQVVSISATSLINRYAKLSVKATYNHKTSDNLPMSGLGRSTIPYALMWTSPGIDINWYKDYKEWVKQYSSQRNNVFYANGDGAYFQAYEQLNTMDQHRLYGATDISIDITKKINLMLRTGMDMTIDSRTQRKPYNSHGYAQGRYREQLLTQAEFNSDFLLRYNDKFSDFGVEAMLGGNINSRKKNSSSTLASALEIEGEYTLANSVSQLLPTIYRSEKQINSLYGMIQTNYKELVFLDITGRNDWSSTLQKGNNSYFYPSVSVSAVLNEIFKMPSRVSLLKARASWANVGNDTAPYAIKNSYSASSFPGGVLLPTVFANPDVKPEMTQSWELGLDARFFKGRLGFDVAYYHATSYNQILNTPVDPAVGYWNVMFNAGKLVNSGWEVSVRGRPVSTKKFRWTSSVVFTRNRNKVVELAEGIDTWVISSSGRAQVEARPGGTMGALYGTGFDRAPQGAFVTLADGTKQDISGAILYDPVTGYPLVGSDVYKYLGDTQPKWKGGISNTVSYKGFALSVNVDASFGGRAYSYSHALLSYTGKLKNSLPGRYDGLIGDGYVYDAADGTYRRNTTVTQFIGGYYDRYYRSDNIESNVFSTSYVKLREARLEYTFPAKWVQKIKVLQGASIAAYGSNLAMWTDWPMYNPEVAALNGSEISTGLEAGSFPMTRSYGVSLKLKF